MLRKVLIVDDSDINRKLLKRLLDDEYEVLEAENGDTALKMLSQDKTVSAVLLDIIMPGIDGYEVLDCIRKDPDTAQIPVIITTGNTEESSEVRALSLGANDYITKPYSSSVVKHRLRNTIKLRETASAVNAMMRDRLTGLFSREAFFRKAEEMIAGQEPGYYVLSCMDIDSFKVINDQYGLAKGDEVLKHMAAAFERGFDELGGICCRIISDNFAVLYPTAYLHSEKLEVIRREASVPGMAIPPLTISTGRYIITDTGLPVSAMYDRAMLAQHSVKGRFDVHVAEYDESMRLELLHEQEIVNEMNAALEQKQFAVWFQPQYNHSTGAMIGAEALVRWHHPIKGVIAPGGFVPVFERNGFIYELDKYVWESVCACLRRWIDSGRMPLPVSVNASRYDIFRSDFYDVFTGLVEKYGVPVDLLRIEITESAFAKTGEKLIAMVQRLTDYGFTVEIDDFGSGYSSFNTLKDVPATILKLDMQFLKSGDNSQRGGSIIESIIRMAEWLSMPVIAEGVETREQADFLRSIGCNYVQGYFYARPMPLGEYEALESASGKEKGMTALKTVETLNNNAFWDPTSMETLIFNSYVGGACIFEYHDDEITLLRVNEKYEQELYDSTSASGNPVLSVKLRDYLDEKNMTLLVDNINHAIETGQESTCEVVMHGFAGKERNYLRTTVRVIAKTKGRYLFYCSIINMTAQREAEHRVLATSQRLKAIMDNISSGITATRFVDGYMDYLFANDRYYDILGYTRRQFRDEIGEYYLSIHPDDREWVTEKIRQVNWTGEPTAMEFRALRRDGREIWLHCAISLAQFLEISDAVQISIINDVTESKRAERKIAESALQLRFLNDISRSILASSDTGDAITAMLRRVMEYFDGRRAYVFEMTDGGTAVCNTYEVCATGVSSEKEKLQQVPLDTVKGWFAAFSSSNCLSIESVDALDDSRPEKQLLAAQGINSLVAVPLRRDGEFVGFMGVDDPREQQSHVGHLEALGDYMTVLLTRRDLTAKIERDGVGISESMEKLLPAALASMMASTTELSFVKDGEFRYVCCSTAFAKMLGLPDVQSIIGKTDYDLFDAALAEQYRADDIELVQSGNSLVDYVEALPAEDGITHYSSTSKYLLHDMTGKVIGLYGTGRDITDDMAAYAQLKLLTDNVPGGLATYECKPGSLRAIYYSNGFCELVGYTREEYGELTKSDAMLQVFEEDRPVIEEQIQLLLHGADSVNCDYRIHIADGGYKWINLRGLVAERQECAAIVHAALFDVTERKQAEEKLRISEEQYRLAQKHSGNIVCRYDVADKSVNMSAETAALFDMPQKVQNVPYEPVKWGTVAPESVDEYTEFYESILYGSPQGTAEYKAIMMGEWHWLKADYSTIFSDDGEPVYAVISLADITAQREATEKLERVSESERMLQLVANHSNRLVFRFDIDAHTGYTDSQRPGWSKLLSLTERLPESVIEAGCVLPESADEYRGMFRDMSDGIASGESNIHMCNDSGQQRWVNMKYSLLYSDDGQPNSAVVSFIDITESHERTLAYERYRQSIEQDAADGNSIAFVETDITADTVERYGGKLMLPGQLPEFDGNRSEMITYLVDNCVEKSSRVKCREFFSREHVMSAFEQGVRSMADDWPVTLPDGRHCWFHSEIQMILDPYSGHIRSYTMLRDVTEEKMSALEVEKKAETDGVTGLYNKATAEAMIESRLGEATGGACTMIIADIDNLKSINDNLGHPQGDIAIKLFADAIRAQFRNTDIIGRIGGDEFVAFLDGVGDREKLKPIMSSLMEKLTGIRLSEAGGVPVQASIGVAVGTKGRDTFAQLYERTDKALYHVKRNGKNDYAIYSPDME